MPEQRTGKTASSILFKLLESIGMQGMSFLVSVFLARLLTPDDYGVVGMLTVFIAFSQVLVQSGLNTALIQKKEADECDLSSAFWFSAGVAAVLYVLLFLLAPTICGMMERPEIAPVLRVLALLLFAGALTSVQGSVVARRMLFRRMMPCNLCATVLSGIVGIAMAASGFGYWALVGQQLTNQFTLAVLLLIFVRWRPRAIFSMQRVATMMRYGWKLLLSSILETGYVNLRSLVTGLKYNEDQLAFFNRGRQFPEMLVSAVNGSVQSVMLPVLSEQQDDPVRVKQIMRRGVRITGFVVLPMMAGLATVAAPMVTLIFGEKWLPCVPFLQICCMDFAFYPIISGNTQALNAVGRSDVVLRQELVKKLYGVAIVLVSLFCFDTPLAIAWGTVLASLLNALVSAAPGKKLLGYGLMEQLRDLAPMALCALLMVVPVWLLGQLPLRPLLLLPLQGISGAAVYLCLSLIMKNDCLPYLLCSIKRMLRRG